MQNSVQRLERNFEFKRQQKVILRYLSKLRSYKQSDITGKKNEQFDTIGIYFYFKNDVIVYIGQANEKSRSIGKRCLQYGCKGNDNGLKTNLSEVDRISELEAINLIKAKMKMVFIGLSNSTKREIELMESYLIALFKPKYNKVK